MHEIYLIDKSSIDRFVTKKLLQLWLDNVLIIDDLNTSDILHRAKCGILDNTIILMDIDIPLTTGVDFAIRLSQFNSNFSLYILSHFINTHVSKTFCNTPLVKDYIAKPINSVDVIKIASENNLSLSKLIKV